MGLRQSCRVGGCGGQEKALRRRQSVGGRRILGEFIWLCKGEPNENEPEKEPQNASRRDAIPGAMITGINHASPTRPDYPIAQRPGQNGYKNVRGEKDDVGP